MVRCCFRRICNVQPGYLSAPGIRSNHNRSDRHGIEYIRRWTGPRRGFPLFIPIGWKMPELGILAAGSRAGRSRGLPYPGRRSCIWEGDFRFLTANRSIASATGKMRRVPAASGGRRMRGRIACAAGSDAFIRPGCADRRLGSVQVARKSRVPGAPSANLPEASPRDDITLST